MKKKYLMPQFDVVEIESHQLLAASFTVEKSSGEVDDDLEGL